ncbi:MAG: efflux RND transporter periplasmic adaptor subunit [Gammaproteobacteria bacterium]|nr:efflux RND transporter periplasmic adaptor subunit [Gammaproteobacteria bacterium]
MVERISTLFSDKEVVAAATPTAPPPKVTVLLAKSSEVKITSELPGRTTPYLVAELRPQVTGIIKERLFVEGSEVKAGELLYRIEPATYQASVDSALALLDRANANLAAAKQRAHRFAELSRSSAVSQQENDEAKAAFQQAEADVRVATAALARARLELDFTSLKSPIAGRIGRSNVTAGALVTTNQVNALATVQQLDPIYVDLTQSSAELLRMKRELASGKLQHDSDATLSVTLLLEDGSSYPHQGKLAFSEVMVDESTGSITLRALFANPLGELLPGMYVRARITQGITHNAFLIPQAAVSYTPRGQPQLLLVNSDHKVEERQVTLSHSHEGQWVVISGLTAGDRVITAGLQKVKAGMAVTLDGQ